MSAPKVDVQSGEPLDPLWISAALGWIEKDDSFSSVTRRIAAGQAIAMGNVAELIEAARNHLEAYGAGYDASERIGADADLRSALARIGGAK